MVLVSVLIGDLVPVVSAFATLFQTMSGASCRFTHSEYGVDDTTFFTTARRQVFGLPSLNG
jgi:hypothetical protein